MRRRSREIPACVILLASAAALTGCETRRDCVDQTGHKLPDSACAASAHGSGAYFLYGGRGGARLGDTVTGGSTTRGGFGSAGEGEGGHGGGGEGGGE